MGVMRPELVMKSIVPVVMAGVLGIYGLIIAVIISTGSKSSSSADSQRLIPSGRFSSLTAILQVSPHEFVALQSTRLLLAHTTCLMDTRTLLLVCPVAWLVWLLVWLLVLLETLVSGDFLSRDIVDMAAMVQQVRLSCSSDCYRANAQQPKLFVGMILILIFAEALALYGLIGKHFSIHLLRITGLNAAALSQHVPPGLC